MILEMTRDELRRRLKPHTREWGTVHADIDEVLDAILGREGKEEKPPSDMWDRMMRDMPR